MHIRNLSTGIMIFFIKEGLIRSDVFKVLEGRNKLEEYLQYELNREKQSLTGEDILLSMSDKNIGHA